MRSRDRAGHELSGLSRGERQGSKHGNRARTGSDPGKQTNPWIEMGGGAGAAGEQLLSPKQDCPVVDPQLSLSTLPVRDDCFLPLASARGYFWEFERVPEAFWGLLYLELCPSMGWPGWDVHTSSPLTYLS